MIIPAAMFLKNRHNSAVKEFMEERIKASKRLVEEAIEAIEA